MISGQLDYIDNVGATTNTKDSNIQQDKTPNPLANQQTANPSFASNNNTTPEQPAKNNDKTPSSSNIHPKQKTVISVTKDADIVVEDPMMDYNNDGYIDDVDFGDAEYEIPKKYDFSYA